MHKDDDEVLAPIQVIDDQHLLRLWQCSRSTLMGAIDQGGAWYNKKLLGLGFMKEVGVGVQVTEDGFAYLKTQQYRLHKI